MVEKNRFNSKAAMFLAALLSPCAFAVDGQVLINQSTLNAAGGTFTITKPGSYKLSGNLQAKDQATPVIVIAADDVTVDLNGFAITGTTDCSSGVFCTNIFGSTAGVTTLAPHFNITIRNGTIRGIGGVGIFLFGDSFLVEYMHIRSNGFAGIVLTRNDQLQSNAVVRNNTVQQNGADGIDIAGGRVSDNVVTENFGNGIDIPFGLGTGTVAGNVVTNNGGYGLLLSGSFNYIGNSMSGNASGNVINGYNQGQNLCGGAACPGAAQ